MFWLIKKPLNGLLSFSRSLTTKCMSLNNEHCISVDDSSANICISNEIKSVNDKVFNMITKINEVKILIKHISSDYKCKFNSTTCNLNQKWNTWNMSM